MKNFLNVLSFLFLLIMSTYQVFAVLEQFLSKRFSGFFIYELIFLFFLIYVLNKSYNSINK